MYEKSIGEAADSAAHARSIRLRAKEWDRCTLRKTGGDPESGIVDYF